MAPNRIRELRLAKGLSMLQMSFLLRLSIQALSKWETGRSVPNHEHRRELAKNLGVRVEDLGLPPSLEPMARKGLAV